MIPLRDTIPSRRWPVMNWLLIGANIVVFYYQSGLTSVGHAHLIQAFGLNSARWVESVLQGRLLIMPLFSYMFLHGDLFHIISNLWALWLFGDNVEDKMGPFRFLGFYLFTGLISGLVQIYFNPAANVPTIGASGAIAGVMGAYFFMYPRARIVTIIPIFIIPWFVEIPAMLYLAFWFLSQVYAALGSMDAATGVAWWAHVGGFLAGLILHRFFITSRRSEKPFGYNNY
jgi:membrane associated rhomboid family serine protease